MSPTSMYTLIFAILVLTVILVFLAYRLVRLLLKRMHGEAAKPPDERDLLYETLREQTVREQEARRVSKEKGQAFEALSAVHQTVMEHLPVGILVLDGGDRVRYANPFFEKLLGIRPAGGAALVDLPRQLQSEVHKLKRDASRYDSRFQIEVNGEVLSLSAALTTLPDEGHLMTLVDKTKENDLEERIRYKRDIELMGEMAGGITHEVKNTLATIQGHVQMLGYGSVEEHAGKVMDEIERLLRFVREFTKSSRDEVLNQRPISLAMWFEDLATHWRERPMGENVTFEPVADPDLTIQGDPVLLENVLRNLIGNGLQACDSTRSPWVRVSVENRPGRISIAVSDGGPGFSAEIRRKLFIPFVSSKPDGTGLGLFHCRKILMAHGGRIEVMNGTPTAVKCHFPVPAKTQNPGEGSPN